MRIGVAVAVAFATLLCSAVVCAARPIRLGRTLVGLACPSTRQCTTLDPNYGSALTFDPTRAQQAIHRLSGLTGMSNRGLACPSTSQCTLIDAHVAAGEAGEETFDPLAATGAPLSPASLAGSLDAVVCPAIHECVAVGGSGEVTFNPDGVGLSKQRLSGSTVGLRAVACPSLTQCTAIGASGALVTFNPAHPGRVREAKRGAELVGIACPSAKVCIETTKYVGVAYVEDPLRPAGAYPFTLPSIGVVDHIACPSARMCVLSGDTDIVTKEVAGRLSVRGLRPPKLSHVKRIGGNDGVQELACPSVAECVALNDRGSAFVFQTG